MNSLTISPDFGYVILTTLGINLQCLFSVREAGRLRRKYDLNYPDMGQGRYSDKLDDNQWLSFNNAQRVHHNYTEQITTCQSLLLISGIYHPKYSAALGLIYMIGREAYYYGYLSKGPKGRLCGAIIIDTSLVSLLGIATYCTVKLLKFI